MAVLMTTNTPRPANSSSVDRRVFGSTCAKMTLRRPTSTTFSRVTRERTEPCTANHAARSPAPSIASWQRVAARVKGVVGGVEARPDDEPGDESGYYERSNNGGSEPGVLRQRIGEVELRDVDPPLLGQLDKIQIAAAVTTQNRIDRRAGVPAEADHLVGDEEVLERWGKTSSSARDSSSSKATTPTSR